MGNQLSYHTKTPSWKQRMKDRKDPGESRAESWGASPSVMRVGFYISSVWRLSLSQLKPALNGTPPSKVGHNYTQECV